MSTRYEWFAARYTDVGAYTEGAELGGEGDAVGAGEVAVMLGADTCTVITGTFEEVEKVLATALHQLRRLPDEVSSVSRQHYIDTGEYLNYSETAEIKAETREYSGAG